MMHTVWYVRYDIKDIFMVWYVGYIIQIISDMCYGICGVTRYVIRYDKIWLYMIIDKWCSMKPMTCDMIYHIRFASDTIWAMLYDMTYDLKSDIRYLWNDISNIPCLVSLHDV